MHMHGKDRMVTFDPGDVGAAGLSNFSFALTQVDQKRKLKVGKLES